MDAMRAQFELERELRRRILESTPENRAAATVAAYNELFEKFPSHRTLRATPEERRRSGRKSAGVVIPLLTRPSRILGVGCGFGDDLAVLRDMGHTCVGVEPSERMLKTCRELSGVEFVLGTADRLDFPEGSFDLVFSQQVLEHLHPADVPLAFAESYRVLTSGGWLVVETPNRRTGPQDVSRGFTPTAEGLHLKEWAFPEVIHQFRVAGFTRVRSVLAPTFLARRNAAVYRLTVAPAWLKAAGDSMLGLVPTLGVRTVVARVLGLNDILIMGSKGRASSTSRAASDA